MGKNKNKQKKNVKKMNTEVAEQEIKIIQMDENMLSAAIVSAHRIIQEEKLKEESVLKEKAKCEWNEIIGQKTYPNNEKWYIAKIHNLRNTWVLFWKIMFMKSSDVSDSRATFALFSLITTDIFSLCKWVLYIGSLIFLMAILIGEIHPIVGIIYGFLSWILARIFRIAALEISKMKDRNLLLAIFSGCISFVALIISLIALFQK